MDPLELLISALSHLPAARHAVVLAVSSRDAGDFPAAAVALQQALASMLLQLGDHDTTRPPADRIALLVGRGTLPATAHASAQRFDALLAQPGPPSLPALHEAAHCLTTIAHGTHAPAPAGGSPLPGSGPSPTPSSTRLGASAYVALAVLGLTVMAAMVVALRPPTDAVEAPPQQGAAVLDAASTAPAATARAVGRRGRVTGSNVLLRQGPSTQERSMGALSRGTTVDILGQQIPTGNGNEAKLRVPTTFYDPSGRAVAFTLEAGKAVAVEEMINDNAYRISFKRGRTLGAAQIDAQHLDWIGGEVWYRVRTELGNVGWIFGEFVEEIR
jgi:hypothetical protein